MSCPYNINNGDKNVLFKVGLLDINSKHLNEDRSNLFYKVCVLVRVILIICIFWLSLIKNNVYQTIFSCILALFALLTIINLARKSQESKKCQWWSNTLEIIFASIALSTCVYCIVKQESCVIYVSIILGISLLAGIIQSFIVKPFSIKSVI